MFIRRAAKIVGDNSISELKEVTIGGVKQWIYLRGQNRDNPIILMLHGDPGTGQIGFIQKFQRELEEHFVIVQWDQRGAGLSYSKNIPPNSMNINQFVKDTIDVTKYILNKLNRQQLYLLGHSWGTIIGMLAIAKAPQFYKRYFGVAQVSDVKSGEKISYARLLDKAEGENNKKAYDDLTKIGPPTWTHLKYDRVHQKYVDNFGGGVTHDNKIVQKMLLNLLMSKE